MQTCRPQVYCNKIPDRPETQVQILMFRGEESIHTGSKNRRKANMERRKYPRVKTCNLISYVSTDENGNILNQSMGRALNISQNGIFLETSRIILSQHISLMSCDVGNNLIEIKGQVAYSMDFGFEKFGAGISFRGNNDEKIQFAIQLIKVYNHRKIRSYAVMDKNWRLVNGNELYDINEVHPVNA